MITKIDRSPEAQHSRYLSRIADALASISSNIGHEMGPMKAQEMMTMSEQMKPEWDRQEEMNHLKRSNKIAYIAAVVAAFGLLMTVVIGAFQLELDYARYNDLKTNQGAVTVNKSQK